MITTHVLDTTVGRPAKRVAVRLEHHHQGQWQLIGSGTTDDDGRLKTLTAPGPVEPGLWRIHFDTGAYFRALQMATFYPSVEIVFEVTDGAAHFHVPLLLNPFGYSTYRGS